jgi:hypothetical protein
MAVGEEEKEALDFDAATAFEKRLEASRAQTGETFEDFVDLMKGFAVGQFVEEFEDGALGRGDGELPVPLTPEFGGEVGREGGVGGGADAVRAMTEQALAVVVNETDAGGERVKPVGRALGSVEVDFFAAAGEVMSEAAEVQRGTAADDELVAEEGLEGDDGLLPVQRASGTLVDAAGGLREPAGGDVMAAEGGRVTVTSKPGGIDEETFGKETGETV